MTRPTVCFLRLEWNEEDKGEDYESSDNETDEHGDVDDFDELMVKEDRTVIDHDDDDREGGNNSADNFDMLVQGHNNDDDTGNDDTGEDKQKFVLGEVHN